MIVHRAHTVLPVAGPPLRNGWVAVDDGRIVACGASAPPPSAETGTAPFRHEPFVILPALVNAHTHIELSYLRGAVPPGDRFDEWIRTLVTARRHYRGTEAAIESAAREAIQEARASGTGLVGDVGNTSITIRLFDAAGMAAHVFYELIGFNAPDPDGLVRRARAHLDAIGPLGRDVRVSLAAHAPYSVAPGLFRALRRELDHGVKTISSLHLAESRDELEFLQHGGGAIRAALNDLGAWDPAWTPPRCGPVEYIARFGLLHRHVLIVHGGQLTDADLQLVKAAGATLVSCPRSNTWTGAGPPPLSRFFASGVPVAIGTDSLTSVDDLNVFNELAAARALAPEVAAARLLESATRTGAEGLGFGSELGTIEPGKRAALIAVRVPAAVGDVEEYLLTGIQPTDIRWLEGEPVSWGAGEP